MSVKKGENFWIEFKVYSDVRKELLSIKIDDDDLSIDDYSEKKILQSIMRNSQLSNLFQKKVPYYLNDTIAQVYQEIKIESNPYFIELFLNKEADMLMDKFSSEFDLKLSKSKKEKNQQTKRFPSEDERNFYKNLKKKASSSKLDLDIIKNEDNLEGLIYLFKDQTILKNLIFFDLFRSWFVFSGKAHKIDELIKQLKKRANIKPGPQSFSIKEINRIIFQYEYLRRIFSLIKEIINKPDSDFETEVQWNKFESFLKENNCFNIKTNKINWREIIKGYKPVKYLGHNWLERNLKYFKEIFLLGLPRDVINDEILKYKREKIINTQNETIERKARVKFLELSCRNVLDRKEYFDLELNIKSEPYGLKYLYKKHKLRLFNTCNYLNINNL